MVLQAEAGWKLKRRIVGKSMGIIVPKKNLVRLKAKKDGALCVAETRDGHVPIPHDPQIENQLKLGREFMARYRNTFRALANRKRSRRGPTSGAGVNHDSANST